MDPDATLKEMRELLAGLTEEHLYQARLDVPEDARPLRAVLDRVERLAELIEAMDEWLDVGGFLPRAWGGKANGS